MESNRIVSINRQNNEDFDSTKSEKNIPADSLAIAGTTNVRPPPPTCKIRNLSVKDPAACRRSIARLMRLRLRGEIGSDLYKELLYGMQVLSTQMRIDVKDDMEEIKEALLERKKRNS